MSGSRVWRSYTSDDGNVYNINVDESKAEASLPGGGSALGPFIPGAPTIPRGVQKLRRVNCFNSANAAQRAIIKIGTIASYNSIVSGSTISEGAGDGTIAITWVVSSKRGEQSRLPIQLDTGLIDGDNP
jgi:hypothetical protein